MKYDNPRDLVPTIILKALHAWLSDKDEAEEKPEETSDKEILEKHGGTQKNTVRYGKGKYRNWKMTWNIAGTTFENDTHDSILSIFRGDSTLFYRSGIKLRYKKLNKE